MNISRKNFLVGAAATAITAPAVDGASLGGIGMAPSARARGLLGGCFTGCMMAQQSKTPTASDYVSDGLIDIIDFMENAGYGQFDDSLLNWYSLKSQNISASPWQRGDTPYFRQDLMYWCKLRLNINFNRYTQISFDNDFTIEFCGRGKNSIIGPNIYNVPTNVYLYVCGATRGWTSVPSTFGMAALDDTSVTHTFRATCSGATIRYGNDGYGLYDGRTLDFSGKTFGSGEVTTYSASSSNVEAVNFKCLRIYNRTLTEEELSKNYLIDKARYGAV